MDPMIEMVNRRTAERRQKYVKKQKARGITPVYVAVAVALACLLFALVGLMHPGLAVPLMGISLMFGCYRLGQCIHIFWRGVRR